MKKIIFSVCLLVFFSAIVIAQEPFNPNNNPTVAAITSKYTLKEVKSEQLSNEQIFPALGNYHPESSTEVTGTIHITLDPQNKGIVWVEGLPQGKIKAYLKVSPSTYKIPAQKTESGTDVAEGVLIYDKALNKLSICIGSPYNETNPSAAFTMNEDESMSVETVDNMDAKSKTAKKTSKTKKEEKNVKPLIVFATKDLPETGTN